MINLRFALLIGVAVLQQLSSTAAANESCDCNIHPFLPTPPCFKVCYVGAASKASSESLQKVLGISENLANKISNLDEIGTSFSAVAEIWQQHNLEGSNIQLANGNKLGELVGYYRTAGTNQIHFAVQSAQTNSLLGIPVDGTTTNANHSIMVQPHTPVYFAIDQPTWYGKRLDIENIPPWTSNQLTKEELETLREKWNKFLRANFMS